MGKQDKTERGKTQLARLRKARGLTQTEIAYDLGVSKATYSSWESGRIELGAGRITALAERLCCTPNDILGFASTPEHDKPARYEPLTEEELHAIKLFRSCPPNIRHSILDIMQTTVKGWRIG